MLRWRDHANSAVEPEVFESRAVVDAIDHRCQVLDVWFAAIRCARIRQDRARVVFDEFPLDLPYNLFALLGVDGPAAQYGNSPDSPLEQVGFEPAVPLAGMRSIWLCGGLVFA